MVKRDHIELVQGWLARRSDCVRAVVWRSSEPAPLSENACEVLQAWKKEQASNSPFLFLNEKLAEEMRKRFEGYIGKPKGEPAGTTCFAPFTDSVSSFAMTLPPEQPDSTALTNRAASDPACRHT
jgi:hypothetical protein